MSLYCCRGVFKAVIRLLCKQFWYSSYCRSVLFNCRYRLYFEHSDKLFSWSIERIWKACKKYVADDFLLCRCPYAFSIFILIFRFWIKRYMDCRTYQPYLRFNGFNSCNVKKKAWQHPPLYRHTKNTKLFWNLSEWEMAAQCAKDHFLLFICNSAISIRTLPHEKHTPKAACINAFSALIA